METAELKLKPKFADDSTGDDLVFGPFASDAAAINRAKANIMAFNSNPNGDQTTPGLTFTENFVSEYGSNFARWSEAHIIITERTNYDLG